MSLDVSKTETDILGKLKAVFPKAVYEDDIPEDDSLKYDSNGMLVPFLIVEWGDLTRMAYDRSLVTVRNDSYLYFFTVTVVTGRAEDTRRLSGHITNSLVGYRPVDAGEISPKGSMRFSRSSTVNRPTQYIRSVTYQCVTNLTTE